MDQRELHALEARCVHDAPPPCTADCPLGVDARGVLEAVAESRFGDGLRLLTTRALLPELVCRVCEEPCRGACPREGTGGSLQVRALEAACVAYGAETTIRRVPPRRGSAAVVGGGLAGMTAALDLALRGYRVRLLEAEDALGGRLRGDARVSPQALRAAVARLERAGVRIEVGLTVDAAALETLAGDPGAVCVACAGLAAAPADGLVLVAAGEHGSSVVAAAAGRAAAAAADRALRGLPAPAAAAAPRPALPEGFGASAPPLPAVIPVNPAAGMTAEEAACEAARCLRCACRECLDACLFLERSTTSPKALLREVNNNLVVTPGMGYRASKATINACRLCGLCAEVCPADIDFGEVFREARRGLHERDAMPPAVHEALLRDVTASNGPGFALARRQPGRTDGRLAFFPGCQLPASRPGPAKAAYEYLVRHVEGGVGLILGCCGAPAAWAGKDEDSATALDGVGRAWESLGRPTLVVACPSCARALAYGRTDIPQVSLWDLLAELDRPPGGADPLRDAGCRPPLAVHDPCAARSEGETRAAVRRLLDAAGCDHRDLPRSGRLTECCGFGGLQSVAAPDLAAATLERQTSADERPFVTTCAMCRDQFAGAGKPALHLLDVLFGDVADTAAAASPGPTWSERRAGRERFARELLRDLWGEEPGGAASVAAGPDVAISAPTRRRLDEALVLESDVAAAVNAAEAGGPGFSAGPGGPLFAGVRLGSVTHWVEYVRGLGGPEVGDAYGHRMEVLGVVPTAAGASELPSAGEADGVSCEACGLGLAVRPVRLTYLGATFDVELPACPSCGAVFVSREVADGRMREVEMSLEDK